MQISIWRRVCVSAEGSQPQSRVVIPGEMAVFLANSRGATRKAGAINVPCDYCLKMESRTCLGGNRCLYSLRIQGAGKRSAPVKFLLGSAPWMEKA